MNDSRLLNGFLTLIIIFHNVRLENCNQDLELQGDLIPSFPMVVAEILSLQIQ